jgi:Icc-related predicted phosphoesterase
VHGHAHSGTERGMTSGGVRVRNVAQPLIGRAYALFDLHVENEKVPSARQVAVEELSRR